MIKELSISLLFLLLIVPLVNADYDKWHYHRDTFTYGNVTYTLKVLANYSVLRFENPIKPFSVQKGYCYEDDLRSYCYVEMDDSQEKLIVDDFGNILATVHVVIIDKVSSIVSTRAISDSSPEFGEEFNITTTLENTGNYDAETVHFEDQLPAGITFVKSDTAAYLSGTKVKWDLGVLETGKTSTIIYTVKSNSYGTKTFTPSLSYMTNNEQYSEAPSSLATAIKNPFDNTYTFTQALSGSSILVNDEAVWTLSLSNLIPNNTLHADITMKIPPALLLVGKTTTSGSSGALTEGKIKNFNFKKDLEDAQTETIAFTVRGINTGKNNFTGSYYLTTTDPNTGQNYEFASNFSSILTVTLQQLSAIITVNRDDISPGQKIKTKLTITNPSSELAYYNLSGILDLGFISETIAKEFIKQQETYTFEKEYIVPPDILFEEFSFDAGYLSVNDEKVRLNTSKKINLLGYNNSLTITQTLSKQSAALGESLNATIKIKNNADGAFSNVKISDKYPGSVQLIWGSPSAALSIAGGQQLTAYSYNIRIPEDFELKSFYVKTVVLTNESGIENVQNAYTRIAITNPLSNSIDEPDPRIIDMENKTIAASGNASRTESSASGAETGAKPPSTQSTTAKKGFWQKFRDFFVNFFK